MLGYAVLNTVTKVFCQINYREVWDTKAAAETAAEIYRDSSNHEFVVVTVSPVS